MGKIGKAALGAAGLASQGMDRLLNPPREEAPKTVQLQSHKVGKYNQAAECVNCGESGFIPKGNYEGKCPLC